MWPDSLLAEVICGGASCPKWFLNLQNWLLLLLPCLHPFIARWSPSCSLSFAGLTEVEGFSDFGYCLLFDETSRDLMEDRNLVWERKYRRKEAQAGMEATIIATLVSTILQLSVRLCLRINARYWYLLQGVHNIRIPQCIRALEESSLVNYTQDTRHASAVNIDVC